MKKLFIFYIFIFLLPLLQHNASALHAQASSGCYVSYKENMGLSEVVGMPELQTAACSLVNTLPATFQSQFKVYSVAYYLHTPLMGDGMPPALAQYVTEIAALSPYYLIIAKENTSKSLVDKFSIVLKLPNTEGFSCLTENDRNFFERQLATEAVSEYNQQGNLPANYPFAEKKVVDLLKKYVAKSLDCCAGGNKMPCESCDVCPDIPSAYGLSDYFKNNLRAIEIPIEIDNCGVPVNTPDLPNVQVLKELKIKFRSTDPFGLVSPMLDKVFKSHYFLDFLPDKYYGFVTSNHAECTDQAAFQEIKATVEDVSSVQARLTGNYEYLIWFHIWQNPAETDKGILYIHSSTPEWSNLAAANAPDINAALEYSFDIDNYDTGTYQNKFEQSIAVVAAEGLFLIDEVVHEGDTEANDNNSLLSEIGCNTSTEIQYYLTAAMQPVALPIGTISVFAKTISNALENKRDIRALLGFTDVHGPWRSMYSGIPQGRKLLGLFNTAHSLTPYDFGASNGNNFEVWLNYEDLMHESYQLQKHTFVRPNTIPANNYGKGEYVLSFYNIGLVSLGAEIRSYQLPIHTLAEFQKANVEATVNQRLGGFLLRVPKIPGSPIYDYYLCSYNKDTGANEWLQFNCGVGDWIKLPGDPFIINNGDFKVLGYVVIHAPWFERFLNTVPLTIHDGLDALGMVPVVGEAFDLINGVVYFMEGEKTLALLSAASSIPLIGNAVAGGKKLLKLGGNAPGVEKVLDKGVYGVAIYKKCTSNKGAENQVCWVAKYLNVSDIAAKTDGLATTTIKVNGVDELVYTDEYRYFLEEVVTISRTQGNELIDLVTSKDHYKAWLVLSENIVDRINPQELTKWTNRLEGYTLPKYKTKIRQKYAKNSNIPGPNNPNPVPPFVYVSFVLGESQEIGRFVNGNLLCTKFDDFYNSAHSWEKVGDKISGCQVYSRPKPGGGFVITVRREPETTSFTSETLDLVKKRDANGHPIYGDSKQHCLERHGPDVSDEALRLRAVEGIAPDGTIAAGQYASKFDTPEQLEAGLSQVKPGSPAFNSALNQLPSNGTELIVTFERSTNLPPFGYGYPKSPDLLAHTLVSEPMHKVKALYKKDEQSGEWILSTMYPDK